MKEKQFELNATRTNSKDGLALGLYFNELD